MKVKKELIPKLTESRNNKYHITFWFKNKRFRYSSGKIIGLDIQPNMEENSIRKRRAELLRSAFELEIEKGWRPEIKALKEIQRPSVIQLSQTTLDRKLAMDFSDAYKADLKRVNRLWIKYCQTEDLQKLLVDELTVEIIREFVINYASSPRSMRNLKRNISSLLKDEAEQHGVMLNLKHIRLPRSKQTLHKPIEDVQGLLNDIKDYNDKLYICALLTYGLLLRPHREIRSLKRNDFNTDFTLLSLDGNRVKSKRNRVLPIPHTIQRELKLRYSELSFEVNLFSNAYQPPHKDYFKGIWTKFKNQSVMLQPNQTLYSFRHTGAIKVFEKTGSLQKLQQVMGHSDMKVSLTYLRGLEVKQLDVEDLPQL